MFNNLLPSEHDAYHGFSLQSIRWGYRDMVARTIESLFEGGFLGEDRQEVTTIFFEFLKRAKQPHFDYVLKEFIGALKPCTYWIMGIPGIFADIVQVGGSLARNKIHYGILYFKILGEGGFGDSPNQVRNLMTYLRRLCEINDDLAIAFLKNYRHLLDRLTSPEIDLYLNEGLKVFVSNKKSGLSFLEGTLKSSEYVLNRLTQECRLSAIQPALKNLLKALVGYEVEVSDLGRLDADELLERQTQMVCMYAWLFVPQRIHYFESAVNNRNWYRLLAVVAAGMLVENSFCRIHGHPDYPTCMQLIGENLLYVNLFQILEYLRVLRRIKQRWPGASALIDFGLHTEFSRRPPQTPPDRLFYDLIMPEQGATLATDRLIRIADDSLNLFDTASQLEGAWMSSVLTQYPRLDIYPLRTFSFLPDFLYPGVVGVPPKDDVIVDLKKQAQNKLMPAHEETSDIERETPLMTEHAGSSDGMNEEGEETATERVLACFIYDEWSQPDNDYCQNYCYLYEQHPKQASQAAIPGELFNAANQIRWVFELFKPDMVKRQKYLQDGDSINSDLLIHYLVQRKQEPSPKVDFYEKSRIKHRDLAVLILLDVSGSTGDQTDQQQVIELEKQAAIILGQGLHTLGDRFAICGFNSNGREHCQYYVYKHFQEKWEPESIGCLLTARPLWSTRMGVALRHSGYLLSQLEAKQRLIMLVTDGKPQDRNYDPKTRYAQHDVRMACEENKRQGIQTFCISTEENSRADMEIMFPQQRFVILSDMRQLPRILPKLYIKMTT